MTDVNYWAVLVAALAAFVAASVYYMAFARQLASLGSAAAGTRPQPWKMLVEFGKTLVLAAVVAGFAARMHITDAPGGLLLGLVAWIGFPVVLLAGSVMHENVPPKLAALHAGDWLVKLLLIGGIVGAWR
jgi:hypothetical protein